MSSFIPFDRSQPYLLPPDLKSWLPADDVAHFIVAAVERVPLGAFSVPRRTGGNLISPSPQTWLQAKAILTQCQAPLDDRYAVLDPMTDANTVAAMMNMFNPAGTVSRQTTDGQMGSKILGVRDWMQDQTVLISQTGSYDSTATATGAYGNYTPNGAPVTTISASASPHSSVITTSAINGTLNAGDVITISGVNRTAWSMRRLPTWRRIRASLRPIW